MKHIDLIEKGLQEYRLTGIRNMKKPVLYTSEQTPRNSLYNCFNDMGIPAYQAEILWYEIMSKKDQNLLSQMIDIFIQAKLIYGDSIARSDSEHCHLEQLRKYQYDNEMEKYNLNELRKSEPSRPLDLLLKEFISECKSISINDKPTRGTYSILASCWHIMGNSPLKANETSFQHMIEHLNWEEIDDKIGNLTSDLDKQRFFERAKGFYCQISEVFDD